MRVDAVYYPYQPKRMITMMERVVRRTQTAERGWLKGCRWEEHGRVACTHHDESAEQVQVQDGARLRVREAVGLLQRKVIGGGARWCSAVGLSRRMPRRSRKEGTSSRRTLAETDVWLGNRVSAGGARHGNARLYTFTYARKTIAI